MRGIERVSEIHHTTVIRWIKKAGIKLPDVPEEDRIPEITKIAVQRMRISIRIAIPCTKRNEFQNFIGNRKNKIWLWMVVNRFLPGTILWTLSDYAVPCLQDREIAATLALKFSGSDLLSLCNMMR